jgi:hypothetical protein
MPNDEQPKALTLIYPKYPFEAADHISSSGPKQRSRPVRQISYRLTAVE